MKKLFYILILLIPISVVSQPVISLRKLDKTNFPQLKAEIRVVENSQTIPVTNNNLLFSEGAFTHRDFTVNQPDAQGWQTIEWIPDHNVIDEKSYTTNFIFTHEKESAFFPLFIDGLEDKIGTFVFKNSNSERIFDLQFVPTAIGDTSLRSINCDYFYNLMTEKKQIIPIRVDSINISNDNFLVEWRGNQFNSNPPPTSILFTSNQILVRFAPYEEGAQSAIIKVFYNRGAVAYLRVQGNKKKIEAKTNLKLNFPNGGETFTPCQDTIIAWEGNVKNIHTRVDLSYDNGETWEKIDSIIADTLDWKIHSKKTSENARVRISQDFTKRAPHIFPVGSSVYSVDYNFNSTKAISFIVGTISEWDLVKLDNSKLDYKLNSRNNDQLPLSAKYISDDRFAAIYSVGNFDTLAIFQVGNTTAIEKISVSDFNPKEIYTLKNKNEFILVPRFGNYFRVYDSQTLQLKKEVIYQQPITDVGIANDTNLMAVSNLDGKVLVVSTTDFQTKDSIEFYRTPVIEKINISPNGKLVGLSSVARANEGRTNSMIWDLETKNIITSVNISGSDPVEIGFSPTGNMAIFAYQYQNQINIYDLVKGLQSGIIETFQDAMYDLSYSSENNAFIVSSVGNGSFKMKQYYFTFPETDVSDESFRIINPIVEKEPFVFGDEYIFNSRKEIFDVEFCNKGEVPLFIDDARFKYQVHFSVDNFDLPDTLLPNECINISVIFNPKDTSIVSDSLILSSCSVDYPVYVTGNGLNRNIVFNSNIIDFGEVCIQDTSYITDKIFTNADPVPLKFNKFQADSSNIFSFENYKQDTILAPGEFVTATVRVVPNIVGDISSDFSVLHSDQEKYKAVAKLFVKGIGTYVEMSHTTMPFINEQRVRKLTIKNIGVDAVEISNLILNPAIDFRINSSTPITIMPGETKEIEIEWIGTEENVSATLELEAVPCLTQRLVNLLDYKAESELVINDTEANPLDTTSISISFTNLENASYKGIRKFEAIVTIDPKIFIPEYAVSDYGDATIENIGIENGKRLMRLTVNGDFPKEGTLAKIVGYPGLSEKNTSTMLFDSEKSVFWGASTSNSENSGLFTLLLTCNDQSIIHTDTEIQTIAPNPVNSTSNIQIYSNEDNEYELLVLDQRGEELHKEKVKLQKGENIVQFDSSGFLSGAYHLVLKKNKIISSKTLVIVK